LQQPFFFLIGPATLLPFDRPKRTDLFVDADQILAEFLEMMELGDLLLCFAQRGGIGKRFSDAFPAHPPGQTELRIVTGVVRLGAMAGWFTAAAHYGCDGTGPQVAEAEEFFQEAGSIGLQTIEGVRHGFLSERYYTLRITTQKRKPPSSRFLCRAPFVKALWLG
jgi:hypothetical protein